MGKIKYLFKHIINVDYKNMLKIAKKEGIIPKYNRVMKIFSHSLKEQF